MTEATRIASAIKEIDTEFHTGYATEHPELIGALIVADQIYLSMNYIGDKLFEITMTLEAFEETLGKVGDVKYIHTINLSD